MMESPGRGHFSGMRRSDFVGRALLLAGAAVGGAAVSRPPRAAQGAIGADDARALNLLLLVEYAEAAFYAAALKGAGLRGELRDYAETVADQEREHLAFLKQTLGPKAESAPHFDFGDATRDARSFAKWAARLEDLAVAAYNGQGANVSPQTLQAAAGVVSVEARHAAWIRSIAGKLPAPDPVDTPQSADAVLATLKRWGLRR
jgi:rubrerythrin